jgi:geranylgeranyl pyrophosphate synthase
MASTLHDGLLRRYDAEVQEYIKAQVFNEFKWSALQSILLQQPEQEVRALCYRLLPVLTCMATGGPAGLAVPLAASWRLYDLASNLFDNLHDGDGLREGRENTNGMNLGLGILAAAELCLAGMTTSHQAHVEIQTSFARTFLFAACGQAKLPREPLLSWYFEHILTKTGMVLAAVAWAGGRLHTNNEAHLQALYEYGLALGTLIQIGDDCYDLRPQSRPGDLASGTLTLPAIYGLSQQQHPGNARLAFLLHAGRPLAPAEIEEAHEILMDMGAIAYSLAVAKVYEQLATAALADLPPENIAYLRAYVSELLPAAVE